MHIISKRCPITYEDWAKLLKDFPPNDAYEYDLGDVSIEELRRLNKEITGHARRHVVPIKDHRVCVTSFFI